MTTHPTTHPTTHTVSPSPWSSVFKHSLGALLFCHAAAMATPLGAFAAGDARWNYACGVTTCPDASGSLFNQAEGAGGSALAGIFYAGSPNVIGSAGGAALEASARLTGALGTPELKARALADNAMGYHPGYDNSVARPYDYGASARASALQTYTYTGASTASYTFSFDVDGTLDTALAFVSAYAAFISEANYLDSGTELPTVRSSRFYSNPGDGSTVDTGRLLFADLLSLTLDFEPGQTYYLFTSLAATVIPTFNGVLDASADAFNTFKLHSITGDTSLLSAGLIGAPGGNVPEPASWALAFMAMGLACAARQRRARSAHDTTW